MLSGQRAVVFSGGLDASLLENWHRHLFDRLSVDAYWFACDRSRDLVWLKRAARIMQGISIEKLRCYVMVGFGNESFDEASWRLEQVYELGFLPFAQLFRPDTAIEYPHAWKELARKWSRPAAYRKRKLESGE
jgi:hypothetical protein